MKPYRLLLAMTVSLLPTLTLADTVKITAGGHTIEFPCSEITDDTDQTCERPVPTSVPKQQCEVIDGIMYIESQEWLFLEAIDDAVDKVTDEDEEEGDTTSSERLRDSRGGLLRQHLIAV